MARAGSKGISLTPIAVRQGMPIAVTGGASGGALPRMLQDVAALEILPILGLHEGEILREMRGVVAHVETRHERVGTGRRLEGLVVFARDPARAQLDEFLVLQRFGGTGIAPAHVPGIFQEHRTHVRPFYRAVEHRPVEWREVVPDVERHLHACRQLLGLVVRSLDPALPRQREHDEVLRAVGVERAEPERQHELRRPVANLERSQEAPVRQRHAVEIHLGDEEMHLLLDVTAEHRLGAVGQAITVVRQKIDEPVALLGGQN